MKEKFREITVLNKPALFTVGRLDRNTVPVGLYAYDVRHDEKRGVPCQIAKFVLFNHWGTILLAEPLKLPERGALNINEKTDWNYTTIDTQPLPAGKIEYLSSKGTVQESKEFMLFQQLMDTGRDDLHDGVPLSIVLYQYGEKPVYPMEWAAEAGCLPKGIRYEKREVHRREPCHTVAEFMKTYLPGQKIQFPEPKKKAINKTGKER